MSIATELTNLAANRDAIKAAIEAKNPSVAPTSALSSFPASIASIPTGGGGDAEPPEKDVIFIDYDGHILHSYTAAEAAQLSALPELPTHEGLTCHGWNYTFAEFAATVADVGEACVGAVYTTSDGKSLIGITVRDPKYATITTQISQTVSGGVTVDWGDGSAAETASGTGNVTLSHTYAAPFPRSYVIAFSVTSGTMDFVGNFLSQSGDSSTVPGYAWGTTIDFAHIGDDVLRLGAGMFDRSAIRYMTVPNNMYSINGNLLSRTVRMAAFVFPRYSSLQIPAYTFQESVISRLSIPGDFTQVKGDAASGNRFVRMCLPHGMTVIGRFARTSNTLQSVNVPSTVTSIEDYAFQNCKALTRMAFPAGLTKITDAVFYGCNGMKTFDFRRASAVPELTNVNAFNGVPADAEIIVPDSLYASWTTATNWSDSSILGKIVKASESSLGAL